MELLFSIIFYYFLLFYSNASTYVHIVGTVCEKERCSFSVRLLIFNLPIFVHTSTMKYREIQYKLSINWKIRVLQRMLPLVESYVGYHSFILFYHWLSYRTGTVYTWKLFGVLYFCKSTALIQILVKYVRRKTITSFRKEFQTMLSNEGQVGLAFSIFFDFVFFIFVHM